jgi:hypothetical protein
MTSYSRTAAGGLNLGDVAGKLADQRPRDWRVDRNLARLDVGFILANDLIAYAGTGFLILEIERCPENATPVSVEQFRVDDLGVRQFALDFLDASLDKALPFLGGIVLGVLREVAVRARLGDRRDGARRSTVFR